MGTGGLDILIAYALLILCHSLFEIVITHFWGCAMMWLTNRNLLCFPLKNLVISGVSAYQILKPHVLSLVFSLTG